MALALIKEIKKSRWLVIAAIYLILSFGTSKAQNIPRDQLGITLNLRAITYGINVSKSKAFFLDFSLGSYYSVNPLKIQAPKNLSMRLRKSIAFGGQNFKMHNSFQSVNVFISSSFSSLKDKVIELPNGTIVRTSAVVSPISLGYSFNFRLFRYFDAFINSNLGLLYWKSEKQWTVSRYTGFGINFSVTNIFFR